MSVERIGDKLNDVAEALLDDLLLPGNALSWDQRIDAFKVLTAYHLGLCKQVGKDDKEPDDPDAFSFNKARARLNGLEKHDAQ